MIRDANALDKIQILKFCKDTFSWGDYIDQVWDFCLSEGKLDGGIITCGWHAAQFDCKTGKLVKFPAKIRDLTSYSVVVESDNVFVEM